MLHSGVPLILSQTDALPHLLAWLSWDWDGGGWRHWTSATAIGRRTSHVGHRRHGTINNVQVVLQLKAHPTFVSDAMAKDVIHHAQRLASLPENEYPASVAMGKRWLTRIEKGEWRLKEDYFWVQPSPMWEMPEDIAQDLAQHSALVFVKGDANYRRLLGDRTWELSIAFDQVCGYFPAPLVPLRTLKAELGCGMAAENVERARREDENWMTNGRYGVVQFYAPEGR